MNYSKAIKQLRNKMFLTQVDFAAHLGVSFQTINRWETGKFEPTMKLKRKLMPLFEKYNIVLEENYGKI